MSQWTHVNANIRIDSLRGLMPVTFKDKLGKICNWEDEDTSHWDDENNPIPCGSEGSIKYIIYENPNQSQLAAYTVSFWGDLRDYNDEEEILNYFNNIVNDEMIRSGILEINIGLNKNDIYLYDDNTKKFKLVNTIPDE